MISAAMSRKAALAVARSELSPAARVFIADASVECADDAEFIARTSQILPALGDLKFSELIGPQVLQFGWHFNPLEKRNARGEWTRDGGGTASQASFGSMIKKAARGVGQVYNVGQSDTHGLPIEDMPPAVAGNVRAEADKAVKIVPGLLGGTRDEWNGHVLAFDSTKATHLLAELDWDGTLYVGDNVASVISDAHANPDKPIALPDAFQVLEHEMIHGVVPDGTAEANKAAYQEFSTAQIEEGFTEYGATLHAPEFFRQMGLADRKTTIEKGGFVDFDDQGRPVKNYYTVHELAVGFLNPVNIAEGNTWGHYPDQTKDAQDWCQEVAKQEGLADLRPGTPGHDRVVELSDEVNRQGAAGKIRVMASQLAFAMTQDHPKVRADNQSMLNLMAGIEQDIHREWATGHALDTVAREKQRVQQQVEQVEREMAERGQL